MSDEAATASLLVDGAAFANSSLISNVVAALGSSAMEWFLLIVVCVVIYWAWQSGRFFALSNNSNQLQRMRRALVKLYERQQEFRDATPKRTELQWQQHGERPPEMPVMESLDAVRFRVAVQSINAAGSASLSWYKERDYGSEKVEIHCHFNHLSEAVRFSPGQIVTIIGNPCKEDQSYVSNLNRSVDCKLKNAILNGCALSICRVTGGLR